MIVIMNDNVYNDNEMIKWYDGYKKRKPQKVSMFAWQPDRVMDWYMSEDERRW